MNEKKQLEQIIDEASEMHGSMHAIAGTSIANMSVLKDPNENLIEGELYYAHIMHTV